MFNPDDFISLYKALHIASINPLGKMHASAQISCEHIFKFLNKQLTSMEISILKKRITSLWEENNQIDVTNTVLINIFKFMDSSLIDSVDTDEIAILVSSLEGIRDQQKALSDSPKDLFERIEELEKQITTLREDKDNENNIERQIEILEKTVEIISLSQFIPAHFTHYTDRLTLIADRARHDLQIFIVFFMNAYDLPHAMLAYEVLVVRSIKLYADKLTNKQREDIIENSPTCIIKLSLSNASDLLNTGKLTSADEYYRKAVYMTQETLNFLSIPRQEECQQAFQTFTKTFMSLLAHIEATIEQFILSHTIPATREFQIQTNEMLNMFSEKWQAHLNLSLVKDLLVQFKTKVDNCFVSYILLLLNKANESIQTNSLQEVDMFYQIATYIFNTDEKHMPASMKEKVNQAFEQFVRMVNTAIYSHVCTGYQLMYAQKLPEAMNFVSHASQLLDYLTLKWQAHHTALQSSFSLPTTSTIQEQPTRAPYSISPLDAMFRIPHSLTVENANGEKVSANSRKRPHSG